MRNILETLIAIVMTVVVLFVIIGVSIFAFWVFAIITAIGVVYFIYKNIVESIAARRKLDE